MNPPHESALATSIDRDRSDAPPVPESIEETGLSEDAIVSLALKALYVQGARMGRDLANFLKLPFRLLDDLLLDLQQRKLVEVTGTRGQGREGYVFDLTTAGRDRSREATEASAYVGPVPVPLEVYSHWVERQSVTHVRVQRDEIAEAFGHLVFEEEFLRKLGPAINSAKSMFLYGHSGNGKTAMAEAIAGMIGGAIYLPYAIDFEGQTIVLLDPVHHRPVEEPEEEDEGPWWMKEVPDHDPRFAHVHRPAVFAGGELTLEELDLKYDPHAKYYQAPFQMKANGGVLIIDDLGRQLVSPRDLLNRWIVPLEKRTDYLTLHTGHKFPVPFECLVVFATNLDPTDLVDEAFLRRIHYKIHVDNPPYEIYERIFRRECEKRDIEFNQAAVRYVFDRFYDRLGIAARSCHPRDVVDHLCDIAKFHGVERKLNHELVGEACESYFLDMPESSLDLPPA